MPSIPPLAPLGRRAFLKDAAVGFGALALAGMGARPILRPKAERVLFLYMDGGVSQVDSFDPKPRLEKDAGKKIALDVPKTQFDDVGSVLPSPWKFSRHGQSGLEISSLFPEIAKHADKLCVVRSMTSKSSEHPGANYYLHTGHGFQGRPSMGAWVGYGLGKASENLPSFVVINGGLVPPGGLEVLGSGFLPPTYQASIFRPEGAAIANVKPHEESRERQLGKLDLLKRLQEARGGQPVNDPAVDAAIDNLELAFRMQTSVPGVTDLQQEDAATREAYGLDAKFRGTQVYGRQCLLARRLLERGVRFVELTCPHVGHDRWDQHSNLRKGHADNARAVDQPIAALLADLEARGMLDTTLVVFAGEFGRTPMAQGKDGRDHNPFGFSIWMAGGGVRGGHTYGSTDEFGYFAVENEVEIHDLHATMLHLLGLDHETLTHRFGGRDMSLTDVHGRIIKDLIA